MNAMEKLNETYKQLENLESFVSSLEHINRKNKSGYTEKRITETWWYKLERLFVNTTIAVKKDSIDVEPHNIQGERFDTDLVATESMKLALGKSRARILDYMIAEVKDLITLAEKEFEESKKELS